MFYKFRQLQILLSVVLILAVLSAPVASSGQDLVSVSSITGGSSVFVFRNIARSIRRTIAPARPTRTKSSRVETARKIKKQYETLAKTAPRRIKTQAVDPSKMETKSLSPEQGSIRFAGIGEFYLEKGDFESSFEAFRDSIRLDETNVAAKTGFSEALVAKGSDLLLNDQAQPAKANFLEALKYNPNNSAAYFGLGEAYAELSETAEAIANYGKALENDKDLTEIYVPLGILHYQAGEIEKADDMLTKALTSSAESAETQFFLGLVRTSQMRNEDALAAFQKAKMLDPTNAEAFFNSAETLVKLKRPEEAVPDYQKTVELKPNHFDAWFGLGEAFYGLGKYPEAKEAYKAAAKLKNNDWAVFAGLGESHRQAREFEPAQANYGLAALFLGGTKDYDRAVLADLYSKAGLVIGQQCDINMQKNIVCQWPAAIKALQKAVDLTDNPIDYVNLGWAYFRAGHAEAENKNMPAARPFLESAQTALQKAVDAGPPASDFALQNLASVQIDLGNNKGAVETLGKLLNARPDTDFARYAIGVAHFKDKDFANAEKWFRAAIENDPRNLTYMMALGNALISRKDSKGLKKLIEEMKKIDPASADDLDKKRQLLRM